ncbi:MAG: hypothetical protein AABX28_02440 [Nanoarchaeota archaeon]
MKDSLDLTREIFETEFLMAYYSMIESRCFPDGVIDYFLQQRITRYSNKFNYN